MDYEVEYHIPNQMEQLIQYRNNADIKGFEHVVGVLKILLKEHKGFLDALDKDMMARVKHNQLLFKDTKKLIIKALDEHNDEEGLNITHAYISQLEAAYNASELKYMDDVLTTCVSYHSDDNARIE